MMAADATKLPAKVSAPMKQLPHVYQCIRDHHSVEQSGNLKCIFNFSYGGLNITLICTFLSITDHAKIQIMTAGSNPVK